MLSSPEGPRELSLFHRAFDLLYPLIRFFYERMLGQVWFTQVTLTLWLGGAPTYRRDFKELLDLGITAVVDLRAERPAAYDFFAGHGIAVRQYRVPDTTVPGPDTLTDAVRWIGARIDEGRVVLIHCAKGRGRSAAVLAAYLMATEGQSFDAVNALLRSRRPLVKLENRHRVALESWIAAERGSDGRLPRHGPAAPPAT